MAKAKYDGVVEAVHYKPNGDVDWVRAYVRRGAAFSDYILIDRQSLIDRLKSGKKYMAGKRIRYNAGTFEVTSPVRVLHRDGKDILVIDGDRTEGDHLDGVPQI